MRFLKRRPVRIAVLGVDVSAPREPSGAEVVAVSPDARVFRVRTATAVLERALLPDDERWVLPAVAG